MSIFTLTPNFPYINYRKLVKFGQSTARNSINTGSYPELCSIKSEQDRQIYLYELVNSYLFKDTLELENIYLVRNAV